MQIHVHPLLLAGLVIFFLTLLCGGLRMSLVTPDPVRWGVMLMSFGVVGVLLSIYINPDWLQFSMTIGLFGATGHRVANRRRPILLGNHAPDDPVSPAFRRWNDRLAYGTYLAGLFAALYVGVH